MGLCHPFSSFKLGFCPAGNVFNAVRLYVYQQDNRKTTKLIFMKLLGRSITFQFQDKAFYFTFLYIFLELYEKQKSILSSDNNREGSNADPDTSLSKSWLLALARVDTV